MKSYKILYGIVLVLALAPANALARSNSLTAGLSTSLDYDDRQYDRVEGDPANGLNTIAEDTSENDYRRIVVSPMISIVSSSQRDSFEVRAAPKIKYDLSSYETDWDNDLFVSAQRFMSRFWELKISNWFLTSDYYNPDSGTGSGVDTPQNTQSTTLNSDPQLSPELGRSRYWRNTLDLSSVHRYRKDSLLAFRFNNIILRNDNSDILGYDDYDRYALILSNEHRFNADWKTLADLEFVRGDYKPTNLETASSVIDTLAPAADLSLTGDNLSEDLREYHLLFTVENDSISKNLLYLTYNYIGTRYDEELRDDGDIQQLRFTWQKDISPRLSTRLGAGPSYEKTEDQDANWGGNGIAEVIYQTKRSSSMVSLEKRYDVDNFSGTDQRGFVDYWLAQLSLSYLVSKDLTIDGNFTYLYEDRENPLFGIGQVLDSDDLRDTLQNDNFDQLDIYHKDRYTAGIGLIYTFMKDYSATLSYTYTTQNSDLYRDFDDHRLLLTLAWQQDLFHW